MASKDTEEAVKEATEGPDVIEADSDGENSDNFEDASDGGGTHDFDRPEEWGDCSDRVGEGGWVRMRVYTFTTLRLLLCI